MKIRSKALYEYLLNSNVLNGTKEDIGKAKREYRRMYQRQWKRQRNPRKEIRLEFTFREYGNIKVRAFDVGLCPTLYVRTIITSSLGASTLIPHKEKLLKVLQLISMTGIEASRESFSVWQVSQQLEQAENMLLDYLNDK